MQFPCSSFNDNLEGYTKWPVCVCLWARNCVRARVSDAHATHLIACGGLFVGTDVNSKEILLDLPSHLFCVMSLPAMWC